MTALRDRVRIGLLGCILAAVALVAIGLFVLLVVAAVPDRVGLLLSVTAASIPALIYATIVLRLDRYESEPLRAVLACFIWGAVGAILFSLAAGLLFQFAIEEVLGAQIAEAASVVIGAPLVEESFKGIAVLAVLIFARDEIDSTLDGLVYGALVGVGFAMTENILYFGQAYLEGGLGEFGTLVVSRAVLGGFGHPAYTAITGAAIGWSRGRYGRGIARVVVPILGWGAGSHSPCRLERWTGANVRLHGRGSRTPEAGCGANRDRDRAGGARALRHRAHVGTARAADPA